MGSGVTNFLSVVEARSLGTADVDKMAAAIDKQTAALEKLGQSANRVNEHPGFSAFAEKIKHGIENPLQAAGEGVKVFLEKMGPMGTGVAAAAATLGVLAKVAFEAAHSLGEYGTQINNVALRTGLSAKEVGQFSFAAKVAGQDVSIFESAMRKLSQGLDDGSKEGDKARRALADLNVVSRDATGALRPMSSIFLQVSEGLRGIDDPAKRNAEALRLFGRAGIEILPSILGLTENIKRAKELGLGATDEDLKRWEEYHRNVVEAEAIWARFTRKIKEPLAATITVLFKDSEGHKYTADELRERGVNLGPFAPRTQQGDEAAARAAGFPPLNAEFNRNIRQDRLLGYTSQIEERRRIDAAIDRLTAARSLEEQLKVAQESFSALAVPTKGSSSMKDVEDYAAAERKVESLKAQIKATKELAEEQKKLDAELKTFAEKTAEAELSAGEKILHQRDELITQAQKLHRSETEIAKVRTEAAAALNTMAEKAMRDFNRFDLGGASKYVSGADRRANVFGSNGILNPFYGYDTVLKETARRWEEDEQVRNIQVAAGRSGITARASRTLSLMQANMGPGQELAAISAAYAERKRLAAELYNFEMASANDRVDREKAFADWKRATQDAEIEHEIKLAELQRRRIEEFRSEMGGLFDAILGGKSGLQQFAMGQLRNVGRVVFSNTITSLATNSPISRQSTFAGAGILGDLLGGQANPLKISTDANTAATVANTQALMRIALSPSGGGGGFSPASASMIARMAGGGGYYGQEGSGEAGWEGTSMPSGTNGDWAGESAYPVRSSASRYAGYGVGAIGVGTGIYGTVTSPSTKGKLASGGATLMAVAPFTGPAAPFVAAAGAVVELFSAFMKDPKQVRAEELERERRSRAFNMPTGYDYSVDTLGRSYDYDYQGRMRPIVINISAMDGQDVQRVLVNNPDAVSAGVSNAVYNDGGQIVSSISQVSA